MSKLTSSKQQGLLDFLGLLESNVQFLAMFATEPTSSATWEHIKDAALQSGLKHSPNKFEAFIRIVSQHRNCSTIPKLLLAVNTYQKASKTVSNNTRAMKRTLATTLGLGQEPQPLAALYEQHQLTIVQRDRMDTVYVCGKGLVDLGNEHLIKSNPYSGDPLVVPADETWYVVAENESAAFVNTEGEVELVVMRGGCIQRPDVICHINKVIDDVVLNRRGVRPNHGGSLIQYGWNAGPRHARVFGLVRNNANKRLEGSNILAAQDKAILGIMSLTWNFLTAFLPKDVINPIRNAVNEAGLPAMASPGDIKEQGYVLNLPNGMVSWGTAERAPAEAYMSQNYTAPIHTDQLYAPYALNWVTKHEVVDTSSATLDVKSRGEACHTTGGNYVDVSLRVVVKCAKDTAMAVKPTFKHGTTLARPGVQRQGIAINFSTHIKKAFDKAQEAGGLSVDDGTKSIN